MRNFAKAVMAAAMMAGAAACGPKYVEPAEGSETGFALSFFRSVNEIVEYDKNYVISPYSAGVALSMLAEGAEGQTRVEFDDALNNCIFRAIDLGGNDTVVVKSANSLWLDDNFSVRNRYVGLLQKDFDAFVDVLPFSDPATVKAINNWCSENTNGKIDNIIDKLRPDMVMVLANALYFNAPWVKAFAPEATKEAVFHGLAGDTKVQMMNTKSTFRYAEYMGCQMVELPYEGGRYAMYVVLPPRNWDANSIIPHIGESVYDAAMNMLSDREVVLRMPKVKLETSLILNEAIQKMGVKSAFTSAADFKGISAMGPLVLDQVKQKCYIDIAEKGTEAAAVTVAQIRLTAARPGAQTAAVMTVDRPYLFFIADHETSNILFAGKVVNL
jgi:serpin B